MNNISRLLLYCLIILYSNMKPIDSNYWLHVHHEVFSCVGNFAFRSLINPILILYIMQSRILISCTYGYMKSDIYVSVQDTFIYGRDCSPYTNLPCHLCHKLVCISTSGFSILFLFIYLLFSPCFALSIFLFSSLCSYTTLS